MITVGVLSSGNFIAGKSYKLMVSTPVSHAAVGLASLSVAHRSALGPAAASYFPAYTPYMHTLSSNGTMARPAPLAPQSPRPA